jgi:hypothetical protein
MYDYHDSTLIWSEDLKNLGNISVRSEFRFEGHGNFNVFLRDEFPQVTVIPRVPKSAYDWCGFFRHKRNCWRISAFSRFKSRGMTSVIMMEKVGIEPYKSRSTIKFRGAANDLLQKKVFFLRFRFKCIRLKKDI